jgi:hypothetical protein
MLDAKDDAPPDQLATYEWALEALLSMSGVWGVAGSGGSGASGDAGVEGSSSSADGSSGSWTLPPGLYCAHAATSR